jgi:hypothetical protein
MSASIEGEGRGIAKREGRPGWMRTPSLLLLALLTLLPGSGSTGAGAEAAGAYPGTSGGNTAIATGVSPAADGDAEGVCLGKAMAPRGFCWLSLFAPPSGIIAAGMASPPAEARMLIATSVRRPNTLATRLKKRRMRPPSVAIGAADGAAQDCAGAPDPGAAVEAATV